MRRAEAEASAGVAEAHAQRLKAESEADALRDLVHSLRGAWARDVAGFRAEVERVRDETRAERDQLAKREAAVLRLVKQHRCVRGPAHGPRMRAASGELTTRADRETVVSLVEDVGARNAEAAQLFEGKVRLLRDEVERSAQETADARALATQLAGELARIRRLAKLPVRDELSAIAAAASDEGNGDDGDEPAPAEPPEPPKAPEAEPGAPEERADTDPADPPSNGPNPNDTHEPDGEEPDTNGAPPA